jgi:hypothetical protein
MSFNLTQFQLSEHLPQTPSISLSPDSSSNQFSPISQSSRSDCDIVSPLESSLRINDNKNQCLNNNIETNNQIISENQIEGYFQFIFFHKIFFFNSNNNSVFFSLNFSF